jgi:2-dehydropantoate 2-reductase
MGAFLASRFIDAAGFVTAVVARGERRERLERDGLVVNGQPYAVTVADPDAPATPADLILVAVKQHHLAGALPDLQRLVGRETTILSVMNGLDSEQMLGAVYGPDKVLYAVAVGIDAVRDRNQVTFSRPGTFFFGEAVNTALSPRVRRVQEAFQRAGITYETPLDMMRILWWKFMVNVGVNQASAVMRAPYGVFQTSPEAQALMEALMHEVLAVARAAGVNLAERDVAEWYTFMNRLSPQGKTSMLQDIEAGRKTEVEAFGGKVVELGQTYGIATPVNETVMRIIQVLERTET